MSKAEAGLIATTEAAGIVQRDMTPVIDALGAWQTSLEQQLDCARLAHAGLLEDSDLAQRIAACNTMASQCRQRWVDQWEALGPTRALADMFDNKVMLLVFGKFNAGKSALCNYLAERFAHHGKDVQYFYLEDGGIIRTEARFSEGATETTARLQGVCLGERLVLLDTPGLHSATAVNAALTQRFIESADAVLWLTSSASPGQVQELDELARELQRGKPLLPIVTRSDYIEEDEIDGSIVKVLCNKSPANRAVQEADVAARATGKLVMLGGHARQLHPPVSVSSYVARTHGGTDSALADAGFERLYAALQDIVAPALAYKQRKPAEIQLHHTQEQVVGDLRNVVGQALFQLQNELLATLASMPHRQEKIVQMAWRQVVPVLPDILQVHAPTGNLAPVCSELATLVGVAFKQHGKAGLAEFHVDFPETIQITLPAGTGYDVVDVGQPECERDDVDVGYDTLYTTLVGEVRHALDTLADTVVAKCVVILEDVHASVVHMQQVIDRHEGHLLEIRNTLHP